MKASLEVKTAEDVDRLARRMYGAVPTVPGVVHVTAVHRAAEGRLPALRIEERTPRSEHDQFALLLARARAGAIVTSGANLRSEPRLSHRLEAWLPSPHRAAMGTALRAWRRARIGEGAPASLVLTSGRDLDLSHPLFAAADRAVVFTSEAAAERLTPSASRRGVEVVGVERPSLRAAIRWLQAKGARTISVETGPSTSRQLYQEPPVVDELLLSVFEGELALELRGGEAFTEARLAELFKEVSEPFTTAGETGLWSFRRYRR